MSDLKMEAEIIFEPHVPYSLRRALDYAGDNGFVASLPQLLHARTNADYDNVIWNTWFTSNSEESVVTTPQGNHVVVAIHGGGIFSTPERFEQVYRASSDRSNPDGFTGQYAARISQKEAGDALEGRLPDGTEIPVFPYEEFKRGITDLPMRYGVILDFELAKKTTRGYDTFDYLRDDMNQIVRAGGVEANNAYLDKYQARRNTKLSGTWHPYNRIDPNQPQTKIPFLAGTKGMLFSENDDPQDWGYDAEYAIGGDACVHNMARYIAVAPRNPSISLRDLDFGS
ncbi:MAG: hypothetical protein VYD01_06550 [Pseudomonadota bacterium]|nr:hypothetical protein [Pseudomonadota bacterium]